jgi:hypothetical protein
MKYLHLLYLLIWIYASQTTQSQRYIYFHIKNLIVIILIKTCAGIYNKNKYKHINVTVVLMAMLVTSF